jgi:hypothetical protein
MKAPNPDTLKSVKSIGTQSIAFAVAQPPAPERRFYQPPAAPVFFGDSAFKVYAADLLAAKFEPKELYAHESYVTGLALAAPRSCRAGTTAT